ncbi:AAA family ATPase [Legionella bozemanae]|uniref:AAA family ATPase n=1 Tax=Legionella bozemanae TaxID=447 RepID=UPI0013EFABBD|nr:AAA family ATPase [Legionella bozemanae]
MRVLQEILEWSNGRPAWQRDALRRLVVNGELLDEDIRILTQICKNSHGLAEEQEIIPLAKEHVPDITVGSGPVSLVSIFHHHGVNALADDQTLKFAPGLTVVYGDNGAGKTGYIRILKDACRARGQEHILGNVVSGTIPITPVVAIKYRIGAEVEPREWAGSGEDELLSRVSVFDTQCAAVYLTEKTDVAFRPFGLDLFDKLVKACKIVRVELEKEQRIIESDLLINVKMQIPEGTVVSRFLNNISLLTNPEEVEALTTLSPEELTRLEFLEKSLLDLENNNPEKVIQQLTLQAGRVKKLIKHLKEIEATLSIDSVESMLCAREKVLLKDEEATQLRKATMSEGMLPGTGTDTWTNLWEGARHFSQEFAYPHKVYPFVEDGAQCVLCQQKLDSIASQRLKQFETFVISTVERDLRMLKDKFFELQKKFTDLDTTFKAADEVLNELSIEYKAITDAICNTILANEDRQKYIILALVENKDFSIDCCSPLLSASDNAEELYEEIEARIKMLRSDTAPQTQKQMIAEVNELRARKILKIHQKIILEDIERRKKYAAYGLCIDETKTQTITQKSTAITKIAVSQKLKQSFKNELLNLSFTHAEVELKEFGGTDGIFYHKLVLTRAPGVDLHKIVSEGEQRCLSIAAFFAELSTADDPSAIVFDDPVSSLDYKWREGVAKRLVLEAKTRQVAVFTHDVVFLLLLKKFAEELDVEQFDQHIRSLSKGAGVCTEELPWVALSVKKKIGYLKKKSQEVDKLFRDGHQDAYEKDTKYLYGLLRESWERALEEVLLGGIVERYRPSIQTQQVAHIADITPDDCKTIEIAMTKCSKWLPGHDQAAAARAPIPMPAELNEDIQALENWVSAIRKRRQ